MTTIGLKSPGPSEYVDFVKWAKEHVRAGDKVHLDDEGTYRTESIDLADHPPFTLFVNGSTLVSNVNADNAKTGHEWNRPLQITGGAGVTVHNLKIRGGGSAPTPPWRATTEGLHAITLRGTKDTWLCHSESSHVLGDHLYLTGWQGQRTSGVLVCEPVGRAARHGIATIHAEDVTVAGGEFHVGLTGLNFETHPDTSVARWQAHDVYVNGGNQILSASGSGDVDDVWLRNIMLPPPTVGVLPRESWFRANVFGPGSPTGAKNPDGTPRRYGHRRNWKLDGIHARKPYSLMDAKFWHVDGLTLIGMHGAVSTAGSRLT